MLKSPLITSIPLLGLVACLGVTTLSLQAKETQGTPRPQRQATPNPAPQPKPLRQVPSNAGIPRLKAIIDSLLKRLQRNEHPLGSRGNLCAIAPGLLGQTDTIWSDRPLFLWRGEADQIVLRHEATNEEVWRQAVMPETRQLSYTGTALQPGQVYIWEVGNSSKLRRFTFAVMPKPQRQQLMEQLQILDSKDQGKQLERAIASLRRADYFGQQGLWSDALQMLYGTENLSPEIGKALEAISTYVCDGVGAITEGDRRDDVGYFKP